MGNREKFLEALKAKRLRQEEAIRKGLGLLRKKLLEKLHTLTPSSNSTPDSQNIVENTGAGLPVTIAVDPAVERAKIIAELNAQLGAGKITVAAVKAQGFAVASVKMDRKNDEGFFKELKQYSKDIIAPIANTCRATVGLREYLNCFHKQGEHEFSHCKLDLNINDPKTPEPLEDRIFNTAASKFGPTMFDEINGRPSAYDKLISGENSAIICDTIE